MPIKTTILFPARAIKHTWAFLKQTARDLNSAANKPLTVWQTIAACSRIATTGQWHYDRQGRPTYPRYKRYIEDLYDTIWGLDND